MDDASPDVAESATREEEQECDHSREPESQNSAPGGPVLDPHRVPAEKHQQAHRRSGERDEPDLR